jgi:hypothetical protein
MLAAWLGETGSFVHTGCLAYRMRVRSGLYVGRASRPVTKSRTGLPARHKKVRRASRPVTKSRTGLPARHKK